MNTAKLQRGESVHHHGRWRQSRHDRHQIARNVIGAKVIATAGSDERVKQGLALGADYGINYNTQDIYAEVMRLTDGKGVNVLYDNIANPKVLPQAFMALGFRGRLVTAGAHGGPNVTINFAHLYPARSPSSAGPAINRPICRNASLQRSRARSARSSASCR